MIDEGTEFGVEVAQGGSRIHGFQGSIDLAGWLLRPGGTAVSFPAAASGCGTTTTASSRNAGAASWVRSSRSMLMSARSRSPCYLKGQQLPAGFDWDLDQLLTFYVEAF